MSGKVGIIGNSENGDLGEAQLDNESNLRVTLGAPRDSAGIPQVTEYYARPGEMAEAIQLEGDGYVAEVAGRLHGVIVDAADAVDVSIKLEDKRSTANPYAVRTLTTVTLRRGSHSMFGLSFKNGLYFDLTGGTGKVTFVYELTG